jgi:CO/xanthine dehydrogenase FAD-binding subunit
VTGTLLTPATMAEVDALDPGTVLLAGGTDLLVRLRDARLSGAESSDGRTLADISRLADAPAPVSVSAGVVRLSALAPLSVLARALTARGLLPGLTTAIGHFASAQIRNRATLGGNLANASPAADTVPPLVVAAALARVRGPGGWREVPVASIAAGPRRTTLAPGEWVESIDVPLWSDGAGGSPAAGYRKVAGRQALAISTVSLAWSWQLSSDGSLRDVRLAAGAVAPVVIRCPAAEAALQGRAPGREVIDAAVAALYEDIRPIDDLRASADYRRAALSGVLIEALAAGGTAGQERRGCTT